MKMQSNVPLAGYTSLGCGGQAEKLIVIEYNEEIPEALKEARGGKVWILGFGANSVVSDKGLPGTTLVFRHGRILRKNDTGVIAEAGVEWDVLVKFTIDHKLWGLELMSGIPGGVGAAVVGNIAAYGQAVKDTLEFVDVLNVKSAEPRQFSNLDLQFEYRSSAFYNDGMEDWLITRAHFKLSPAQTKRLTYQSALDVAKELGKSTGSQSDLREIILQTRARSKSLLLHGGSKNAGSFFRNPIVTPEQAERIIAFDESGKTAEEIRKMNTVHGGSAVRVSASHVLLAAGFNRGQSWGAVRLHPEHILRLENTGGAKGQEVYDVAQEIITTIKQKLGVELKPEVRFLGEFN